MIREYRQDQELFGIPLDWYDGDGALHNFSTGWTFTGKIVDRSARGTVLVTKASGFTGAASSPNLTIDFSTTDFSTLTPATNGTDFELILYARRTSDSKDAVFPTPIIFKLHPAPA